MAGQGIGWWNGWGGLERRGTLGRTVVSAAFSGESFLVTKPSDSASPTSGRGEVAKHDVAVVGGGVIGLSLAWELLRRGQRVVIMDRAPVGRATSWAAAGILPPANADRATDPIDRLRGFSHVLWPVWCRQLAAATGIDPQLHRCGGLYLAETPGEAAAMTGMEGYWQDLNIDCQRLSRQQLLADFPWLRPWVESNRWITGHPEAAGWWTPDEYQIRPPRFLSALERACQLAGADIRTPFAASHISADAGGVTVEASGAESGPAVRACQVVLCGGAASGWLDPRMRLQQAIVPIRGQILLLHHEAIRQRMIVNLGHQYLIARGDGHVLVGSSEEEVGFQLGTTKEVMDELQAFARRLMPELNGATERTRWSGLRPMTFDGFPMLGTLPDTTGTTWHGRVHVAAGHYRSGVHLAPGTAVAMADHLQGKRSFMGLDAFGVGKQQSSTS